MGNTLAIHLNKVLVDNDIFYLFLGKYVGARVEDPECYVDGKLNYGLLIIFGDVLIYIN